MIRCAECLYPDSRPDSHFEAGVCSACWAMRERKSIDWDRRSQALDILLTNSRNRHGGSYDCVVPVSGGKDSTYQVIELQRRGARVLAVNAATDMLSEIGRKNLDNLKNLCDVIEVTPNIEVRKRLIRVGLEQVGDMSWPEHNAIWSIPSGMAMRFGIPLVVWGEQPQREYANPAGVPVATNLDAAWVNQFGGMLGLRLDDLRGFAAHELAPYRFPPLFEEEGLKGIWLSDYVDWDGWKNAFVAKQYGFQTLPGVVEGSLADYENLDNHVTVLRDYLRYLKYGYGRACDIACNHIRRSRLGRAEGMALIERAEVFPQTSLGMPIIEVLAWCGLDQATYVRECDRWTNPDLFVHIGDRRDGKSWQRRRDGLTPVLKAPGYSL